MAPQPGNGADTIDADLDQLTYSAYLLILDPALALSVVMSALDGTLEDLGAQSDLLRRTVEISLKQLKRDSSMDPDCEASAVDAALYAESKAPISKTFLSLKENTGETPILSLDGGARIAFVLHHVLGYQIREVCSMADMTEDEYRSQLRRAYVQLASFQFGPHGLYSSVLQESALA